MTGFSIICNKFPSLLSSLLRFFAALYPFGAHCLEEKFAQLASISTDCGTERRSNREQPENIPRGTGILPVLGVQS
jgi:hypothetical protein